MPGLVLTTWIFTIAILPFDVRLSMQSSTTEVSERVINANNLNLWLQFSSNSGLYLKANSEINLSFGLWEEAGVPEKNQCVPR